MTENSHQSSAKITWSSRVMTSSASQKTKAKARKCNGNVRKLTMYNFQADNCSDAPLRFYIPLLPTHPVDSLTHHLLNSESWTALNLIERLIIWEVSEVNWKRKVKRFDTRLLSRCSNPAGSEFVVFTLINLRRIPMGKWKCQQNDKVQRLGEKSQRHSWLMIEKEFFKKIKKLHRHTTTITAPPMTKQRT